MDGRKVFTRGSIVLAVTVLVLTGTIWQTRGADDDGSAGRTLMSYVKGIEGNTPEGRRHYITSKLKEFGVPFSVDPFDTVITRRAGRLDTLHGENIIVTMGDGNRPIFVGAHSDAVPGAPGANDNGGGVAVVLELIRSLKEYGFRHRVEFCFFDREENGLIGSSVFVRERNISSTALAMINLDVEGTGDEIYVGPVGGGDDDLIMKYIHEARGRTNYHYYEDAYFPDSDHESFAKAKVENISISVVPTGDGEKLSTWVKSGYKQFEKPEDIPKVLKVMHSPRDSSTYVTPGALNMSYVFVKTTILLLDEGEQ